MSRSRQVTSGASILLRDGKNKGMEDWLATRAKRKLKRDCKVALVLFNYSGDNALSQSYFFSGFLKSRFFTIGIRMKN